MKILVVSYWFPPQNMIGAVRVGKFTKYLVGQGHEVRVITSVPAGPDNTLPLEIPPQNVLQASDWNIDALFDPLMEWLRALRTAGRMRPGTSPSSRPAPAAQSGGESHGLRRFLRAQYYAFLRIPDSRAGWYGHALESGRGLIRGWRPDLIYASSPPVTGLVVANRLSREFNIPWIAELRDLWTDNPYYEHPKWRLALDRLIERRVLRRAAALVTVTPLWGEDLRRKFDKAVHVVLNGYVAEDFPTTVPRFSAEDGTLNIVYTGNIYRGFRDPSPLFAAIALLREKREFVKVHFFGPSLMDVKELAENYGVFDRIVVHDRVSYQRSLEIQMGADVLLLMQWNNPADQGNIPAKFFEYLAAGRPILFLGYEAGTLAQMIRERAAGFVGNAPEAIAVQLAAWIAQQRQGGVPRVPESARAGLARDEQFRELENISQKVAATAAK